MTLSQLSRGIALALDAYLARAHESARLHLVSSIRWGRTVRPRKPAPVVVADPHGFIALQRTTEHVADLFAQAVATRAA